MSLINQMLKDLESRRNPELPAGGVLPGSRPTAASARVRPQTLFLSLLIVLLALGITYLLWQQQHTPQAKAPPATASLPAATPQAIPTTQPADTPPASPPAVSAVITPRQPPLEQPIPSAQPVPIHSRLSSITPSVIDGSNESRTLILKGEALGSGHHIVVNWGAQEKILPPDRIEWLDSSTARIRLTTGNSDALWRVALIRPDGSRSEAVEFEVIASPYADSDSAIASGTGQQMEKVIHPPSAADQAAQLYQQGYRALQQRNNSSAEQLWRQALNTDPNHQPSREGLLALYLAQGRKVESAELLAEGVRRHPEQAQFAMLHARLLAEQGETAAALTVLEQAMGKTEPQAELFALAAALYQQHHDYDNSIRTYQRALQMQPQQANWWMGIGISLEGAGKPAEARSAYEEALKRGGLSKESRQYVAQRRDSLK